MLAECVRPPPAAEIVSGYVPIDAGFFTDTVSVELPELMTDVGLNDALVRGGNPVKLKLTVPENGPEGVIVTLYVVCEPLLTV
jgi:hypothetical protein